MDAPKPKKISQREMVQKDLLILMNADLISSPYGSMSIDKEVCLHLYTALRSVIVRKIKQKIFQQRTAELNLTEGQAEIFDTIAEQAASDAVASAALALRESTPYPKVDDHPALASPSPQKKSKIEPAIKAGSSQQ